MRVKINIKNIIGVSINIFIGMLLFLLLLQVANNTSILDTWYSITPGIIMVLIYHIFFMILHKVSYTDFRLWYIILSYIFMFGIVVLYYFNLTESIYWDVTWKFSEESLKVTGVYCLCSIHMIFTGFFWTSEKSKVVNKKTIDEKALHNAAVVLLAISFPCRLIADIGNVIAAQVAGSYNAITAGTGLVDDFAILFVPAVILLCVSGDSSKKINKQVLGGTIIYHVLTMILTGDRRNAVIAILALFLFKKEFFDKKQKIDAFRLLLYGIIIILALNGVALLKRTRLDSLLSLSGFISLYFESIFSVGWLDTIYETLGEFGLSFYSVSNLFATIPSMYPFQYGLTILKSVIMIFPIGWLFGDFLQNVTMSSIVNKATGIPVGASLIGDMYSDFGLIGAIASGIVGYLIYNSMQFRKYDNSNFRTGMYFLMFYVNINLVRATIAEVIRPIAWMTILLFVVFRIRRNNLEVK